MFGIGSGELLIILLLALLVLGPRRLPTVARTLGRGLREITRAKNELTDTVMRETQAKELHEIRDAFSSGMRLTDDPPTPTQSEGARPPGGDPRPPV